MHFVTLEDEDGLLQAVFGPRMYEAHRAPIHESPLLIIEGAVQRKDKVINLIATRRCSIELNACIITPDNLRILSTAPCVETLLDFPF
jgi:DNA polymerase III alpha subunit